MADGKPELPQEIKRPNYFTSQFLVEDDFKDEQAYHAQMRHLHNRALHVWGVVDGLAVSKTGAQEVTVTEGMAIDGKGREVVLPALQKKRVPLENNGDLFVVISYKQDDQNPKYEYKGTGLTDTKYTRTVEGAQLDITGSAPDDGSVVLARLKVEQNKLADNPDNGVRRIAGSIMRRGSGTSDLYIAADGKVGIGTNKPDTRLHVAGAGDTELSLQSKDNNRRWTLQASAGTEGENTAPAGYFQIIDRTAVKSRLTISTDGNVGVGTNNPGKSKLKILKSASDFADVKFFEDGSGQLEMVGWGSGWNINARSSGKNLYLNRDAEENSNVLVGRKGKELIVRGKDGNVGVGTTAPLGPLAVGDSSVDQSDGYIVLGKKSGSNTRQFRLGFDEQYNFVIGDYGNNNAAGTWKAQFAVHWEAPSNSLYVNSSGNVGIGQQTPTGKLSIRGSEKLVKLPGEYHSTGNAHDFSLYVTGSSTTAAKLQQAGLRPGDLVEMLNVRREVDTISDAVVRVKGQGVTTSGHGPLHVVRPADDPVFRVDDYRGSPVLSISGEGRVGVGTNDPAKAKLEVKGAVDHSVSKYGFLRNPYSVNTDGTAEVTGKVKDAFTSPFSIWAERRVGAEEYNAFSDERIKNVRGRSDGAADLRTLLGIEVTDYRHRDVIGKGGGAYKKVVGQQVEKVFPQAVSRHTDVVPDIYRRASIRDGWVALATDLKRGERVKLIAAQGEGVREVLEVAEGGFRVAFGHGEGEVFVFGREVDDFRAVDYDAIAMLNVSATQQLKREMDEEVKALRAANAELTARLDAVGSAVENLLLTTR